MKAIEFEAIAKDGVIKVPKEYREVMQDKLRIIVLIEEDKQLKTSKTKKRELKAVKIKTKGFKFNRDEANER